jgi:hypothetical protein
MVLSMVGNVIDNLLSSESARPDDAQQTSYRAVLLAYRTGGGQRWDTRYPRVRQDRTVDRMQVKPFPVMRIFTHCVRHHLFLTYMSAAAAWLETDAGDSGRKRGGCVPLRESLSSRQGFPRSSPYRPVRFSVGRWSLRLQKSGPLHDCSTGPVLTQESSHGRQCVALDNRAFLCSSSYWWRQPQCGKVHSINSRALSPACRHYL